MPVSHAYQRLEPLALDLAQGVLTPAVRSRIFKRSSSSGMRKNPHIECDCVRALQPTSRTRCRNPTPGASGTSSGLFVLLGLDPFSSLDPAVREIAQTRELGERTVFYAQRLPNLVDMQVERLAYEFATMPETKRLLANADSIAAAAAATGSVVGELPGLIDREREAAIRQFMEALTVETATHARARGCNCGARSKRARPPRIRSTPPSVPSTSWWQDSKSQRPADLPRNAAGGRSISPSTRPRRPRSAVPPMISRRSSRASSAAPRRSTQAAERAAATLQDVDRSCLLAPDRADRRCCSLGGLGAALAYRGIVRRWLA